MKSNVSLINLTFLIMQSWFSQEFDMSANKLYFSELKHTPLRVSLLPCK